MDGEAYYNEIDPYCVEWLRNRIAGGHIAPGIVDDRPIQEVRPDDLKGFGQCHFFAGIGGWSLALRLAGWPDARPVWTGSCPCQGLSAAGKGLGTEDPRHLWPVWFPLIRECNPVRVFGEQVASKDGLAWLDLVYADMEAAGYSVGAVDLCAAGVGAPHIRQRLWFVADANGGNASAERQQAPRQEGASPQRPHGSSRADLVMGNAERGGREGGSIAGPAQASLAPGAGASRHWAELEWLPCTDGKQRPTKSGIFPLAHGVSARVAKLRAAGNAITPQVAAEFIRAAMP